MKNCNCRGNIAEKGHSHWFLKKSDFNNVYERAIIVHIFWIISETVLFMFLSLRAIVHLRICNPTDGLEAVVKEPFVLILLIMIEEIFGQDHVINSLNDSIASHDIFHNNLGLHGKTTSKERW
jgi:hypothetical protein